MSAFVVSAAGALSASAQAPTCDAAAMSRARLFLAGVLADEAQGERMDELLGRSTGQRFYQRVAYDAAEEPGWDTITIRPRYGIVAADCSSSTFRLTVLFEAGTWFSRERFGPDDPATVVYELGMESGRLLITSRLPPPFVSIAGAETLLGRPPFDNPQLISLKNELATLGGRHGGK